MPQLLNGGQPIATLDGYADALQLGPVARARQLVLNVIGANAVVVQCWRYTDRQKVKRELELIERTIPGQSIGVTFGNCAGIRVRSAVAGAASLVTGTLEWEGDVSVLGVYVTAAKFGPDGSVTG